MALNLPITADGLTVDIGVNLPAALVLAGIQSGARSLPIPGRALIDTGADLTAVSDPILQRLGSRVVGQVNTQGIGGTARADLHLVSLYLYDARNLGVPLLPFSLIAVTALSPGIPYDVLIGLNVIRKLRLWVDGPGGYFTLDY